MVKKQKKFKKYTWIDMVSPTKRELNVVTKKYNFHPLDIEDVFSTIKLSKVEAYDDYLFILLNVPRFDRQERVIKAEEIDIFVTQDTMITVHHGGVYTMTKAFKEIGRAQKTVYDAVYKLIDMLIERTMPMLEHIAEDIDEAENNMYRGAESKMVKRIFDMQRNADNLFRIVNPMELAMLSLVKKTPVFFPKSFIRYADDLSEQTNRITRIIQWQFDTIKSLRNTNEVLLSSKLRIVLVILTVLSVISMPIGLVFNVFSFADVFLPQAPDITTFWYSVEIVVVLIVVLLGIFRIKKWI